MDIHSLRVTGSLDVTGSITSTGTITAQTLVVQTVTSSIEFVTGSTRNGSLSSNTHQFTGSVLMSGSLDVAGTTSITGVLTLSSTISNGTFAYTLPSATGTLALTSALSGYLPLTGGTLTGALSGTSATFSGEIATTNGQIAISNTTGGGVPSSGIGIRYNGVMYVYPGPTAFVVRKHDNSGDNFVILNSGAATFSSTVQANGIFRQYIAAGYYADFAYNGTTYNLGSSETTDNIDFKIAGGGAFTTGGKFRWFTQAGGATPVERFSIASTGAATFSSSVTAGSSGQVFLTGNAGTNSIGMRFTNTGGNSFIGLSNSVGTGYLSGTAYAFNIQTEGAQDLQFGTNNANRLIISSTGAATFSSSVTIGSTLSNSLSVGLNQPTTDTLNQIFAGQAAFGGQNSAGGETDIGHNWYYYSGWKYRFTSPSSNIKLNGDVISFERAASGTANAAISFLESMRITSAGNVGIGNTNPGSYSAPASQLVVGTTSGNNGITIVGGTTGFSNLYLADGTTGNEAYRGYIEYGHSADYMAFGTAASERMRIKSGGQIAMNNEVFNTNTSGTTRTLFIGNGNFEIGGVSSIRASKKNIENLSNVDWLYQLNPVAFNYRKKDEDGSYTEEIYKEINYGLIAEDTESIAEFLINYNDKIDGNKEMIGIEYSRLITPMLKAIQELSAENDTLKEILQRNNIQ
jgi:hypothetical protein